MSQEATHSPTEGSARPSNSAGFEFRNESGRQITACRYGEVWKAEWQGASVIIKRYLPSEFSQYGPQHRDRFVRRLQILQAATHPHIGRIYGLSQSSTDMYVVAEYAERGTIRLLLDQRRRGLGPEMAMIYVSQILSALLRLAANDPPLHHNNLKSSNLLLTPSGIKLTDPLDADPYSVDTPYPSVSASLVSSLPYLPPEILRYVTVGPPPVASANASSTAKAAGAQDRRRAQLATPVSPIDAIAHPPLPARGKPQPMQVVSEEKAGVSLQSVAQSKEDHTTSPTHSARDVYAVSVLWWEMLTAEVPYSGMDAPSLRNAVIEGYRPPLPERILPDISACIRAGWHSNPTNRPPLRDLLNGIGWIQEGFKADSQPGESANDASSNVDLTSKHQKLTGPLSRHIPAVMYLEPFVPPDSVAGILKVAGFLPSDIQPFIDVGVTIEEFKELDPKYWEDEPFCLSDTVIGHLLRVRDTLKREDSQDIYRLKTSLDIPL